jgi:hypothetical protein
MSKLYKFNDLDREVVILIMLRVGQQRNLGSNPSKLKGFFLFSQTSKPTLGPTQRTIQMELGLFHPGIRRQGCIFNLDLHLVSRLKMSGGLLPFLHTSLWRRQRQIYIYDFISPY